MNNDIKHLDATLPDDLAAQACARLERSRQTIRQSVRNNLAERQAAQQARASGSPAAWFSLVKSLPGVDLLWAAAQQWWAQHPLHRAASALNAATRSSVQPVAQRHPFALLGAAVLVGAALARFAPVRRLFTPALLAGMLPPLLHKLVAKAPVQGWLAVLASLAQASTTAKAPAASAAMPHAASSAMPHATSAAVTPPTAAAQRPNGAFTQPG